jgi:hypothetical protein
LAPFDDVVKPEVLPDAAVMITEPVTSEPSFEMVSAALAPPLVPPIRSLMVTRRALKLPMDEA